MTQLPGTSSEFLPPHQPTPCDEPEVGIIGAGVVGLSTAYALLERGIEVRVHEVGQPGAAQSGGETRIFRHAHADLRLISDTVQSRRTYDDWARDLDVELISPDGTVTLGPHVLDQLPLLLEAGVEARLIDSDEVARRLPILGAYDGPALFDARGGAIRTQRLIRVLVEQIGDRLDIDEVLSVRHVGDEVEVRSGSSTYRYRRLIVCAGVQSARFARTLGASLPITQAAHVCATYDLRDAPPAQLSTLIDASGYFGFGGVYGSAPPGNDQFAVGRATETPVRPDLSVMHPDDLAHFADDASDYVRTALPGLDPTPVEIRHGWVTRLAWGSDGLGVWDLDGVLVPAGHNLYKQAPGLGRHLAAIVAGEPFPAHLRPEATLGTG